MERATPKVDVFMLGCCMFYVLSHGGRPFDDPDPAMRWNKYVLIGNIQSGKSNLGEWAPSATIAYTY